MARVDARDWILVCGGFHDEGGMDRANAALARHLAATGVRVHLVAHRVAPALAALPGVCTTVLAKPGGSYMAGELRLERAAHRLVSRRSSSGSRPVLLANGGNARGADINWVHSVHHAWPVVDLGAPLAFRVKNRAMKAWSRRRERQAIGGATLVIANSERTRNDIVTHLGVAADRVRTVYLGADPSWSVPSAEERAAARSRWSIDPARPVVLFCGAIGHDRNKGLDTLLDAWRRLPPAWDADLIVAGGGAVGFWREAAGRISPAIRVLGHTASIRDILAASDLLVSPARYEAYGLAVQEALCRGLPAIVSASAGIVERFSGEAHALALRDPGDAAGLAERLLQWRADPAGWARRFEATASALRRRTWDDMAEEIADLSSHLPMARGCASATAAS